MARALATATQKLNDEHRKIHLVMKYNDIDERRASLQHTVLLHKTNKIVERHKFFTHWQIELPRTDALGSDAITAISSGVNHWAEHGSFYICNQCNSVLTIKMPYIFLKNPTVSKRTKCQCITKRYIVPRIKDILGQLLNLSTECLNALRPFYIDCRHYKRQAHGYRVKTGMVQLFPSPKPVVEKIRNLPNRCDRQKCRIAYNYLIASSQSSYSHFIELRDVIQSERTFNCFDFSITVGIEWALWPYPNPFKLV